MKHFSEISASAERVVDAAEDLVQRHGYTGFSYDDVARAIGIKKPSIHHHFATKAELVAVVAQRYTHRFRQQLLHIDGTAAGPPEKLAAYAQLFARTYAMDRRFCVCGMLGAEAASLPDGVAIEVNRFFQANLDWLTAVFITGLDTGRLRFAGDPSEQADGFLCALEGSMVVGRGVNAERSPADVARTLISNVLA